MHTAGMSGVLGIATMLFLAPMLTARSRSYDSRHFAPVAILAAWSLVMWIWMLATPIPAMQRQECIEVRQPTIFYALILAIAVSDDAETIDVWFAWAYVGLRIAHSI